MEDSYIHIHPAWVGGIAMFLLSLSGVIWNNLGRRITKIEEEKVDTGHCKLKERLAVEKFNSFSQRLEDKQSMDEEKYEAIIKSIHELCSFQRDTNKELGHMSKCLALLAAGAECPEA